MKKEIIEPGFVYHLYNRGNNKENVFIEERNYLFFLHLMKKYLLVISDVYAYCLLKNHFHILLRIKEYDKLPEKYKAKISQPISNMFNAYTKSINKIYKRSGSLFQEHPRRQRVENEKYLINLLLYIHLNPAKHGFTDNYRMYRYSSYSAYLSNDVTNIDRDAIFDMMEGKENFIYLHEQKKIMYNELLEEIESMDI